MNKLSSLRGAYGLTLMGAGGKEPWLSALEDYEKKKINTNNKAEAHIPSGIFHFTQHPKNKGEILFFLFSSTQKKIYLFCILYISIMHQALAHTGMKYIMRLVIAIRICCYNAFFCIKTSSKLITSANISEHPGNNGTGALPH